MKNIYRVFSLWALAAIIVSCEPEEFMDTAPAKYEYVGVPVSRLPGSVFEGTGAVNSSLEVPLVYGNDVAPGRPVEVTMRTAAGSTAVLGEHFTVEGANVSGQEFTVTIPADSYTSSFTVNTITDTEQNDNRVVTFEIVSVSEGVNIGYPFGESYTLTLLDDDCPYDFDRFVGTAVVMEEGYGPYNANTTEVAPNTIVTDNFWDVGAEVTMVLVPCDGTVNVPDQEWDYFGSTGTINGSGTWDDEEGVLVITFNLALPDYNFTSTETHTYTFPL